MKVIRQIFIILFFFIIGEMLSYLIGLAFPKIFVPGTILGLFVFLIVLLSSKTRLKVEDVDQVGTFLTSNMSFFFIPAAVSVLDYFNILKDVYFKIVIIIIISLVISFIAIYYTVKLTIVIQNKILNKRSIND